MSLIGKRVDDEHPQSEDRIEDFVTLAELQVMIDIKKETIRSWINNEKITGINCKKNRMGHIIVHKKSIVLLEQYRDYMEDFEKKKKG